MLASIVFNYTLALCIDRFRERRGLAKAFLVIATAGNLSLFFTYKYLDFFLENINRFGFSFELPGFLLPIGISFFTFQAMSYVIDVYRGTVPVQKAPQNIGLYISFFPQLIAGPIVRYKTIAEEINHRRETLDDFSEGVRRFIIGLGKKVILANNMVLIADAAFAAPDAERSVLYAWAGALAYAFQIFFDFSGYSDMAIGLGKMFGFHFLENFNYPYISKSISEFWRRWHISLGQWFRDYVYFPLGGSRVDSRWRLLFNLFVVWLLTGVWHGASWNFIAWGLLYFVLIAFEKVTGYPEAFHHTITKRAYQALAMLAVLAGWVLFRATSGSAALAYGRGMLHIGGNVWICDQGIYVLRENWAFFLAAVVCSTPLFPKLKAVLSAKNSVFLRVCVNVLPVLFYVFLLLWSVSYIILGSYNPFIYFNF